MLDRIDPPARCQRVGFMDPTMHMHRLRRKFLEFLKQSVLINAGNENVSAEQKCEAEKMHSLLP